jgi:putative acetyltransferase
LLLRFAWSAKRLHYGGVHIRNEGIADIEAIRRVNEAAFGQPDEARLVDALREQATPFFSLVAEDGGAVVGHICFTPVEVGDTVILGLAPMAVSPERQNQGIGTRLVEAGLRECRRAGFGAVVVLGHPQYYPRFGFEPAAPKGLRSEYDVPDDVFMLLELVPGAAAELKGTARYHRAFRDLV